MEQVKANIQIQSVDINADLGLNNISINTSIGEPPSEIVVNMNQNEIPLAFDLPVTDVDIAADLTIYGGGGGSDVKGVKGAAETTYRTGYVNLTPKNIGAAAASDLAAVATTGDYNDLINKPIIPDPPIIDYPVTDVKVDGVTVVTNKVANILMPVVPTALSQLENDTGFITAAAVPTNVSELNNDAGYITQAAVPTQLSSFQNDMEFITQAAIPTNLSAFTDDVGYVVASNLAAVATSGSYTDLSNKPHIPTSSDYVDLTTAQEIDGQKDFNEIPRVKIDGEHPREGLPDTYTQLQYVESSGSQYINTGYIINTSTDIVEMTFECVGTTIYKWLFGEHDNNARFGLGVGDGANKRNVAYGATTYKVNDVLFYNSLHNFKADSTGVFIDNNKIANYSSFSSTSTLALFCLNNDGFVNGTAARIQSYKHTRNGVALIDLVPVTRNSDNKAGFYDFVSENFIGSATSTDLIPGPGLPGPHYENLLTDANFASVAFSGSYNDLSNAPTTVSSFTNDAGYITSSYHDSTKANQSALNQVTAKIPSEASSSNQLADKAFVNSSIQTATATFLGTYNSIAEIETLTADDNDYAFYRHTDSAGNTLFDRYKYNGTTWLYEYTLNNSSFTSDQWAAINSGVALGEWVDKSTAQVISGQKDFNTIPRVKVTHETHNLPDAYQEVEYLQSSGTQFIDSGYAPNGNSKVIFDSILGVGSVSSDIRQGRHADGQRLSLALVSSKLEFAIGGYLSVNYNTANQRHTYELDVPSRQGKMDGTTLATFSASSWTSQQTLYFFARHMSSGQDGLGNVRNYSVEVYEQGQLVRQYIPCYRKSDDEPGMYDTVNDVFYTNIGTGTFIVGSDIYPITYESLLTDASFASVAFSGSYTDLVNKPTIPTVNNATLTIQKNGTTVNTFTANAASNVTCNITVPTKVSDITNDSGYQTASDVNTLIDIYMQGHYDNGDTEVY